MATNSHVQIELRAETVELFDRYHKHTGTTPETYITQLVEKTLPTVQAMVDAIDEASESPEKNIDVMELFGRKMAAASLEQKKQATAEPLTV
ncbi:hypothetical protein [Colwellia sp. PAMC 21821]|uniref:hypothetical protein n=1 Tax=Colwellia sp. PAMC 21821 TaxID=1816219 RepID=UPI0009BD609E|nr:hypothetical protein [Colwellia sp. PAMC 21821]ARD44870.1 hypothetical protein A3Q33_11485 [Colwellia sp. PAMC 21821]